jgi:hypothetical protein
MWNALCIVILVFTCSYLGKSGVQTLLARKKERQQERQKRVEERKKTIQDKILKLVHSTGQTNMYNLCSILEPLGFSEEEIQREKNELVIEGKIKQL